MPKYTNSRLNIDASEDFSPFGSTFASLMAIVEDRIDELCNLLSATEDADDLAVSDIAYTATLVGTSSNANALAVGPAGTTNPTFKVVCSTTSCATGISITGAAAAGGVAVAVISSGTNENLTIDAKGSGTISLNATGTGGITLARATTFSAGAVFSAATTAISISGATTTGISITGNATTGIALATGTFTTGISIGGTVTTGLSIGASTTAIKITGAQTQIFDFTGVTTAVVEDNKAYPDKAGSIKILTPAGAAAYINYYDGSAA